MRFRSVVPVAVAFGVVACTESGRAPLAPPDRPAFTHVPPAFIAPNFPNLDPQPCTTAGYDFGFRIQPPPPADFNGTYAVQIGPVTSGIITITTADQFTFAWTSAPAAFGVDAVIASNPDGSNLYIYAPESYGDTGLHPPGDPDAENFGISSIDVCFDFEVRVAKIAKTTYTRTYAWSIDKTADVAQLQLTRDEVRTVNYTVTLDATTTDSDWAVEGLIKVDNPTPFPAVLASISDIVSPGIAAVVTCPVTFPFTLPPIAPGPVTAGITCSYTAQLPDALPRENRATVTTNGDRTTVNQPGPGPRVYGLGGVGGGFATAPVVFGDPTNEVDRSVAVTDSYAGALTPVTRGTLRHVFLYSRDVSFSTCGEFTVPNTASFLTNDTQASGSDDWSVAVSVTGCAPVRNCTLTQGYWKTHSVHGPAGPPDPAWGDLADAAFFLSGQTWYQVLGTSPRGDAYYILAHQYIAAKLNVLSGASPAAIASALAQAESLLAAATPGNVPGSQRSTFTALAATLDAYNNGLVGPGHCP